jgi:hypothetical protein
MGIPQKNCWICGKTVKLEDCKVDEHGLAVHENCYVTRITFSGPVDHTRIVSTLQKVIGGIRRSH